MKISAFIFTALLASSAFAQSDADTVALIGKRPVSRAEFSERIELNPWPQRHRPGRQEYIKLGFLYTIASEKLWADEADTHNLDTMEILRSAFRSVEKMYVRDALYKIEVKDKAQMTEKEYIGGLFRNSTELKIHFLFSKDKNEIDQLYGMLNKGINFDTLLSTRPEFKEQQEPVEISFGKMEEYLEDSLYATKAGQFTTPINTPDGYYIFLIKEIGPQIFNNPEEKEKADNDVKNVIGKRLTDKAYKKFFSSFFSDKKIDVDAALFKSLYKKITALYYEKLKNGEQPVKGSYILYAPDYIKIKTLAGSDTLKMPFIKIAGNPVSFGQFIAETAFQGFAINEIDSVKIRILLNSFVRNFIEGELLAREGYNRGLEKLPDVKRSINMWHDNYLCQLMQSKVVDSIKISDEEALSYYNKNFKADSVKQVNIIEVLTDKPETVEKILNELKSGSDMRDLARKYTLRDWTKKQGGEFGFFPVTMYGEIGRVAGTLEIGEVYGPLKVPEGYSVFKLTGKKESKPEGVKTFDDVKEQIKKDIAGGKAHQKIVDYTVKLAKKYGIDINSSILKSIEISPVNMMGYRYMGFGGKLTAVPIVTPFMEWIDKWNDSKKELP